MVSIYKNTAARSDGKAALHPPKTHGITSAAYFAPAVLNAVNPVAQAYAVLNGLAAYAGAQDV